MSMENYKYSVLYKTSVSLKINSSINNEGYKNIKLPSSDIVSIAIIHNYDEATYPIIRLRIYTEMKNVMYLTEQPDDINVSITMYGNVYRMNDNDAKTTTPVAPAENIEMSLKGYIENKNIPISIMDNYDNGIEKATDLNTLKKVPIEIFCYDDKLIHFMRTKAESIYKDMTIDSIIETIFRNQGITNISIDPLWTPIKYKQVLIPNLNITKTIAFFDSMYGMYLKGGQLYGDIDKVYISNTDVNNRTQCLPIFVESYKNNSDMGGLRKSNSMYNMNTKYENISIISETDIERVLNAPQISSVNINDFHVDNASLENLYPEIFKEIQMSAENYMQNSSNREETLRNIEKYANEVSKKIRVPTIMHKSKNTYIPSTIAARIYERLTRIDVSGVGFDVGKLKINTRYNLIFDSTIRGLDINQRYRATYVNHVFTNLNSDLFIAQTTMNLCNN